ncbi:glutamate-5-semialdehyde dehydrogenase [Wolinella succinogenes]|uniref:glutamate-5-semialdehyde dehydrogenase n=1 Tax=Wolinella succinogenes TaxID=844 RepID=UPI0016BBDA02|nr:glutamate-5-semialdehyde dehydrogenase [Wolinella succinogenes]NLU33889.1 glutamate-5-semialdehyde dehydrogenase [Wolinella succinogenes]
MEAFLQKAKQASRAIATLLPQRRNEILRAMAGAIRESQEMILNANALDLKEAQASGLKGSMLERLALDGPKIAGMARAIEEIAMLRNPLGRIIDGWVVENGLRIEKVSTPIGVVGIIYESRPNVTSDTAALCFKSGNVCVLKGGKEAKRSNEAIASVMQAVLKVNNLPIEAISLLPDASREGVAKLVKMDQYVDLIVPRGGNALISFVSENATIPVIKHDKGLCHLYIHEEADFAKALPIVINAKTQRPSVCNAIETLLVDETIHERFLLELRPLLEEKGTEIRGCEKSLKILRGKRASEEDFHTEYGENILNVRVVKGFEEALEHIVIYGSQHSESIITQNHSIAERFLEEVDASSVYVNASTRFTDGGEFGFGAEVGISTSKLHARGPMGINELTTYKFKIYGEGQIRK